MLDRARHASITLRQSTPAKRSQALESIGQAISADRIAIVEANARDLARASGLSDAMLDRLRLDEARVQAMVAAIKEVAHQPDPLVAPRDFGVRPSGIRVTKQRVPLGVIAVIYEARPNVTAECAALALRSGNAVVLRGGKEALESNRAIAGAIRTGLERAEQPPDVVTFIDDTSRETVTELLRATGKVDLVIPRGGATLMALVDAEARVPVIRHGQGICHVYIDQSCDAAMAIEIAFNSKAQRTGVCNAMETLLVHRSRLEQVLPELGRRLAALDFELRADPEAQQALERAHVPARTARAEDWDTEFLGPILAVRTVGDLDEALEHIARHGTHHTASIVTSDEAHARRFLDQVDASCVLWNASTRLNDGGELGLGAEIGTSTSKMHAYGPMGAAELTTEKWVVYGSGQIRGSRR
jgi:glutamate-5-semialdehyde dehydrogenase